MSIFEKFLGKKKEESNEIKDNTAEIIAEWEKKEEKSLAEKIKQMAYTEAEISLGTDTTVKLADVSKLGPNDFNYTTRVDELVKSKLNDPAWVENAKIKVTGKDYNGPSGITPSDELYHPGGANKEMLAARAKEQDKIEELKNSIENNLN